MRILRRLLQIALLLLTAAIALCAAGVIVSQTAAFRGWLAGVIERQGGRYLDGQLAIGRLDGNLFFNAELGDIAVSRQGVAVVAIKNVAVRYDALRLLSGKIALTSVQLDHPVIVVAGAHGEGGLSGLLRPRKPAGGKGPSPAVSIDAVSIRDGEVHLGGQPPTGQDRPALVVPRDIDRLNAQLSLDTTPAGTRVEIRRLSLRGRSPDVACEQVSGTLILKGSDWLLDDMTVRALDSALNVHGTIHRDTTTSLDLGVTGARLDLPVIGRVVPALAEFPLRPDLDVAVRGPLAALDVRFDVRSGASGIVSGQVVVGAILPDHHVAGTVRLERFDASPFIPRASWHTDVSGVARMDIGFFPGASGTDVRGTYRVEAERAAGLGYEARNVKASGRIDGLRVALDTTATAYGSRTTAKGTIQLPHAGGDVAYDLRGHADQLDLRRLPRALGLPRAESRLTFDYAVNGRGNAVSGHADLDNSSLAAAQLEPGMKTTFRYEGRQLVYTVAGSVSDLDLQRFGREFAIVALDAPRYRSHLSGHVEASGSGTRVSTLRLDADGVLTDSTFMGATLPRLAWSAHVADGTLDAKLDGRFAGFDPAVVVENASLEGALAGQANLTLSLSHLGDPSRSHSLFDDLGLAGTVGLGPSTFGGVRVDSLALDGRLAARSAEIRRLAVAGPDVTGTANGRLELGANGESTLSYQFNAPRLDHLATLVGQGLAGSLTTTGKVTGNGKELRANGTVKGAELAVAGAQALNLASQYDVALPDLDFAKLNVRATTSATAVTVEGQRLDEATAKTAYTNRTLEFDASVRQPDRQAHAAGTMRLDGARQEWRLRQLGLRAQKVNWEMPAGSPGIVRYDADVIEVKDIRLANGEQHLTVDGRIAPEGSRLQAHLGAVDLAGADALLLGNRGLSGRLDADATVTGPRNALAVAAKLSVANGAFRQAKYDSLTGTVEYARDQLAIDLRLNEKANAWLDASGTLPLALLRATATAAETGQGVSLHVESSPIDLGLVQGLTTAVQNVTGTATLNAHLSGTVGKPALDGRIDVSGGSLRVPSTGVTYHGLDARIALQADRVTIERLSVADEHGAALEVTGDVAVHEGQLGAFNLHTRGRSFEVVHNEFGRLRLNPDLTVEGQLRQPRIAGTLAVDTGTVNLDPLLDLLSSSYVAPAAPLPVRPATSKPAGAAGGQPAGAVEVPGTPPSSAKPATAPPPAQAGAQGGLLGGLALAVRVTVPDDLVIRGNDIRIGESSLGLGNVGLTIGGDVRVEKTPGRTARVVGTVQTIRGTYQFQGRRFDIQRGGTLRFEGGRNIDPALDVLATRLITGVEARVHVGGTARAPALTLTSDPPLDQADVLSLIIFNRPANQLGAGQQASLAQSAGAIATGFVASRLAQSIGSVLNLDTFEIQTGGGGTGGSGATVTLGQQVGQRLYVKLQQGVGGDAGSVFILDYQLTDFLRFESKVAQGTTATHTIVRRTDQSGADLVFVFRF